MSETPIRTYQTIDTIIAKVSQSEATKSFGGWILCLYPSSDSSDYRDCPAPSDGTDLQMERRQYQSSPHFEKQSTEKRRAWQICRGRREFAKGDERPVRNLCYHHTTGNCHRRAALPADDGRHRGVAFGRRAA